MSRKSNSKEAIRWKALRKKNDYGRVSMVQGLVDNFPLEVIDDGGHHQTVNCTNHHGGKLTIGLCYENDRKKRKSKSMHCNNSNKHLLLLQRIEDSILKFSTIDHNTTNLRAQFLYGVQTKAYQFFQR
jgi:hypothetical protein